MARDRREAEAEDRPPWVGWEGRRNPHPQYRTEGVRYFDAGKFPYYYAPDQLYDLGADVFEQNNLIDRPEHAVLVAQLQQMLREELARLPHGFGEFRK